MRHITLGRRSFLRLVACSGLLSLSGCSFATTGPTLGFPRGVLPIEFLHALPSQWRYQVFKNQSAIDFYKFQQIRDVDLVAFADGWLTHAPHELFQNLGANKLLDSLNNQAIDFLNGLGPTFASKVFPIAMSPWVLIFRRGEEFLPRANESWDILLDPALKGEVILPNSPRLIMSLAERMSQDDSLRLLRSQARSFDDKNGLNWLISGKAKVAVLPLQYCLSNLTRDPRLSIALPKKGCPLNWTLVLRPKESVEPFPSAWIQKSWRLPLLVNLLVMGIIPPLAYDELTEAIDLLPKQFQFIFRKGKVFKNAWSLPPLSSIEEKVLEERWTRSTP